MFGCALSPPETPIALYVYNNIEPTMSSSFTMTHMERNFNWQQLAHQCTWLTVKSSMNFHVHNWSLLLPRTFQYFYWKSSINTHNLWELSGVKGNSNTFHPSVLLIVCVLSSVTNSTYTMNWWYKKCFSYSNPLTLQLKAFSSYYPFPPLCW